MRPQFLVNKFQTGQRFEGYPNVAHLVSEVTSFKNNRKHQMSTTTQGRRFHKCHWEESPRDRISSSLGGGHLADQGP